MMTLASSTTALGAQTTAAAATMSPAEAAKRASIAKTAKDFETSFINAMLAPMFEGVTTSAPFGGGEGEQQFKSFQIEAFAKQMSDHGGLGVAATVQREMLKLQGLS